MCYIYDDMITYVKYLDKFGLQKKLAELRYNEAYKYFFWLSIWKANDLDIGVIYFSSL